MVMMVATLVSIEVVLMVAMMSILMTMVIAMSRIIFVLTFMLLRKSSKLYVSRVCMPMSLCQTVWGRRVHARCMDHM